MDFRLLGTIEVSTDAGALALGGPRARAVLAALALNVGRAVPTDQLIEDLWGGLPPASAGHTLETYIYRLRRALETGRPHGARLATRPSGYMLDAAPDLVDVYRFRGLAAQGGEAVEQGDAAAAAALVASALALWRGSALADVRDAAAFAALAAQQLDDERLAALDTLVEARLRLGQHRELVPELAKLAAGSPYRESFHSQLMLSLYRSGRQAEALSAFRHARELLTDGLGIEPSRELRDLERAILLQAPELELTSGGAIQRALRPLVVRPPTLAAGDRGPNSGRRWRTTVRARAGAGWRWAAGGAMVAVAAAIGLPVLLAANSRNPREPADAVVELTAAGNGVDRSIALSTPPGAAVSADGSVWVTSPAGNVVYRIAPASGSIVETIPVGSSPTAITAAGGDIWVANTLGGTVSRINEAVNEVVGTINVGPEPTGITFGGGAIWVADAANSTVEEIDPVSGRLRFTIALDSAPFGVAFGAGSLWVTSPAKDTVTRVDPRSGQPGQQIAVGSGPTVAVFGLGSVWVVNGLDSTVSRVDPGTDAVAATIPVGNGPVALGVSDDFVWAADRLSATLTKINAANDSTSTTNAVGGGVGLTGLGGHLWVAAGVAGKAPPTGGTLRVVSSVIPTSVDPAVLPPNNLPPFSNGTYDELVAFQQAGGSGALQLVPDLAIAMPTVSQDGMVYTFTLRPGLRYSTGQPVRPENFRRAMERALSLNADADPNLDGIVGATACKVGGSCNLTRGVTVNDQADTVTFHLMAPESDFLYQIATVFTAPVPPDVPALRASRTPVPGTGPYMVAHFTPGRTATFVRNPHFREWSAAAQPQGSPDKILWTYTPSLALERTDIETDKADWSEDGLSDPSAFQAQFPEQTHVSAVPVMVYTAFNTRVAPFNDPRVRRAFSLAANRRKLVTLLGGPNFATPTCQILPPGIPGYQPYCPFSTDASPSGIWVGPDLAKARTLVEASGTKGMRVTVWSDDQGSDGPVGAFTVAVLRELGYRATLHRASHSAVVEATSDSRRNIQATDGAWGAEFPLASTFFDDLFRCSDFRLADPADTANGSFFCDPAIDRLMNRADSDQTTDPEQAAATWTTVDRAVTFDAPWVPLVTVNNVDFVSARVTNYQFSPFLGILLDQLHVRH
jgi:YVTN family beta-propeller protein